jgi:uncharacterized protein
MSDEAANVAVLTEAYRRWHDSRGGGLDHLISICDANIKFGSLAQGAPKIEYMTAYTGRDDLLKYFEGLARDWEMIEYRVDQFIAQGDRVVMLGHCSWRAKTTGRVCSTPKADVWRFANGKAVEFYEFFDTAAAVAAMS